MVDTGFLPLINSFKRVSPKPSKIFVATLLQEVLELLQFIFVVMFTVFLAECVEYEYLFRDKLVPDHLPGTKLSLHDVTKKVGFYEMHFLTQVFIMISALFWLTRVIVVFHRVFQFWDIKCFYNSALKIPDTSLESVTWWEVQEKLVTAQVGVIRLYCFHACHALVRCHRSMALIDNIDVEFLCFS